LRLIQVKLGSTIHRFGKTTKLRRSQRRTTSIVQPPVVAIVVTIFGPCCSGSAKTRSMAAAHLLQQLTRPVAVLNIGGRHANAEQEAERVDEDTTLAARELLTRTEALRVERSIPF
jgi:hypothetical protein